MRSAAVLPAAWQGRYPERAEDPGESRDRQFWRALATPLWSARLAMRRGMAFVADVEARGQDLASAGDERLAAQLRDLRRLFSLHGLTAELCARSFALARELSGRRLGLRPHPCQLLAGWAMLNGRVAEMDTGEGKTLSIALAAATAALAHQRVHVITVNDYLVERDAGELEPLYAALGLRVAGVSAAVAEPAARAARWRADVVYCSNKGLVFDYLRDRVAMGPRRSLLHRELDRLAGKPAPLLAGLEFGIVDEADSVLIDECRTPLVLSRERPPQYPAQVFDEALGLARRLGDGDFHVHAGERRVHLTDDGCATLAKLAADRGDFWAAARRREDLVRQALSALHLFRRDDHYLVRDDAVRIIDPGTGRVLPDRSWELGLQQMIEIKEGCKLTGGRETLARITYQRFFGRYPRLGAATGTACEVAGELWRVYGLRVLRVPRHRPSRNRAMGTTFHADSASHCADVVRRVRALCDRQRPVLLATRLLATSERFSAALTAAGLPHAVLNARNDAAEAAVVARAGLAGRITIATNMAGRGTDIKLGGGTDVLGGLHVIGAELNESGRLDRQLFGRAGRQGDEGSHERVLCLDDDLLRAQSPGWLRAWAARRLAAHPPSGRLLAAGLLRFVQWRIETRAARQRQLALEDDRRIGDVLSFAGTME